MHAFMNSNLWVKIPKPRLIYADSGTCQAVEAKLKNEYYQLKIEQMTFYIHSYDHKKNEGIHIHVSTHNQLEPLLSLRSKLTY